MLSLFLPRLLEARLEPRASVFQLFEISVLQVTLAAHHVLMNSRVHSLTDSIHKSVNILWELCPELCLGSAITEFFVKRWGKSAENIGKLSQWGIWGGVVP